MKNAAELAAEAIFHRLAELKEVRRQREERPLAGALYQLPDDYQPPEPVADESILLLGTAVIALETMADRFREMHRNGVPVTLEEVASLLDNVAAEFRRKVP